MMNYMNAGLLPTGVDPAAVQDWLAQTGYGAGAAGAPAAAMPGAAPGVVLDPRTGQPLAHPAGPNYDLTGWDGVSDKMRYFAQNARYNRLNAAALQAQPGVSTSGTGGGGGGFGQLLHTIFGRSHGAGAA